MKIVIVGRHAEGKTRLVEALEGTLKRFDGGRTVSIGDGQRPAPDPAWGRSQIEVYVTNDAEDASNFIQES